MVLSSNHAVWSDAFLSGLALGAFLGILVGPMVWRWLAWRWWKEADRRLDRSQQLLERMAEEKAEPDRREEAPR